MNLKIQKIFVFISSIVIIGFGIYYYLKFGQQEEVLSHGEIVTGELIGIGEKSKGGSRTYTVRVGTITDYLDSGPNVWDKLKVGDKVQVRFLEGNSEIISINKIPKRDKYISVLSIIIGLVIGVYSVLYKGQKVTINIDELNLIDGKASNYKTLENYFRKVLIHPKTVFDEMSKEQISEKFQELYLKENLEMQGYLNKALNRTDWKIPLIYLAIVRNEKLPLESFLHEFKRITNCYSKIPIEYYEKILLLFLNSAYIDNPETQNETNNILMKKLSLQLYQGIKNKNTST